MIDARNVFRKVNRTINDFSLDQMANLSCNRLALSGDVEYDLHQLVQGYLLCRDCYGREAGKTIFSPFRFPEVSFSSVDEVFANVRIEIEEAEKPRDDSAAFLYRQPTSWPKPHGAYGRSHGTPFGHQHISQEPRRARPNPSPSGARGLRRLRTDSRALAGHGETWIDLIAAS